MSDQGERLQQLLLKFADDQASEAEIQLMLDLLEEQGGQEGQGGQNELAWVLETLRTRNAAGHLSSSPTPDWEKMWLHIHPPISPVRRIYKHRWQISAAAVLILALLTGTWLWLKPHTFKAIPPETGTTPSGIVQDIAPGRTRAVLTLADGSHITLDSASNGLLKQQGNTSIHNDHGALTYIPKAPNGGSVFYNSLTTHRGEQYPLTLSDGTKVWLNAASSIRFPVSFEGKERKVEISGEAWFQVAKDPSKPFRVAIIPPNPTTSGLTAASGSPKQEIEVLGTEFNVNAYGDEDGIRTTLVDGMVRLHSGNQTHLLDPGQQGVMYDHSSTRIINDVDIDDVIAWKNGYFQFTNADLPALIRQLSRWYDLEVVYQGTIGHHEFNGKITRNISLVSLLKALKISGVNFRIEGNKLIVIS